MGLLETLGEYFVGTRTMREFERERNFYREFSGDGERPWAYKVNIQMSHFYEKFNLAVGKWLPNICDIASITGYIESDNPRLLIGVVLSEALRALDNYSVIKPHFEKIKKLQREVKRSLLEEKADKNYDAKFYP